MPAPNPTGGVVEYIRPGATFTCTAHGPISGGDILMLDGDRRVVRATAGVVGLVGVALHDAVDGEIVTVANTGCWPVKVSANVVAGAPLIVGATAGQVATAGAAPDARFVVGTALEAITSPNAGRVMLGGVL